MPKIEHVNLFVTAIGPTLEFLQAAFPDWRLRGEGGGEWAGAPRRWVHFGDEEFYVTLNDFTPAHGKTEGGQRKRDSTAPGLAHIGFEVGSLDAVTERLEKAGYAPHHHGEDHPHRRNAYFLDREGLEFEFVEYLSDAPAERNLYL